MPVYGGGKAKLGKEIYQVIKDVETITGRGGTYFEPFCGLLGVQIHFAIEGRKSLACDSNKDIILMFQALQKGWIPPSECSKKKFDSLRLSSEHTPERGYLGVACAYSGIFFSGYRTSFGRRNYLQNFKNGIMKMVPYLDKIRFLSGRSYDRFRPKGMTIYCDPPYRGNGFRSEHFQGFDHEKFWEVMREWSRDNLVIISEYDAPRDFICIWEKKTRATYHSASVHRVEKLFILGR